MIDRVKLFLILSLILSFIIGFLNLNYLKGIVSVQSFNEPPYLSYPYLNIVWKATDLSFISMSFPKLVLDKLFFVWPIFGLFLLVNLVKSKRIKFKSKFSFYILISFIISLFYIFNFLTSTTNSYLFIQTILSILMIPASLFIYFVVYGYIYAKFTNSNFNIIESIDCLRLSYGKMFIFVYLLGMGTDAIPIDEHGLYTNKFGEDRAWQIITFRNWIFDIMFFSLMYLYPLILITDKKIHIKDSFQKVSDLFKSHKMNIFKIGFLYYLFNMVSVFILHSFLTNNQIIDYSFKFIVGSILFLTTNYFVIRLVFDSKAQEITNSK